MEVPITSITQSFPTGNGENTFLIELLYQITHLKHEIASCFESIHQFPNSLRHHGLVADISRKDVATFHARICAQVQCQWIENQYITRLQHVVLRVSDKKSQRCTPSEGLCSFIQDGRAVKPGCVASVTHCWSIGNIYKLLRCR